MVPWNRPARTGNGRAGRYAGSMAGYDIRVFGDPVLRQRSAEVEEVTGALLKVVERMIETMYAAPGLGLAAPQVGVQKRLFVYDLHDGQGAKTIVNPVISESRGEWTYEEGCLSVPGLSWEIVRPKEIHLTGFDLDGREVSIEADELTARLYQHELDHLEGTLLLDRLDEETRKGAMKAIREAMMAGTFVAEKRGADAGAPEPEPPPRAGRRIAGLRLPGLPGLD